MDAFFVDLFAEIQPDLWTEEASDAQVASLVRLLGIRSGMRVLDAPVGDGRIAVRLARLGCDVVGVDRSEAMLTAAARRAADAGVPLALHDHDLREPVATDAFDLALCLWGSFGFFDDAGLDAQTAAAAQALVPGGRFVLDTPTAETLALGFAPTSCKRIGERFLVEERTLDPVTGGVDATWTLVRGDGTRASARFRYRLHGITELCGRLRRHGLDRVEVYADLDGTPFVVGVARRAVVVATKGEASA
ncbi:MAG: class I SAM-dependent methyltransferase [Alphaproteobacteria bacterium]|nr:class I SAM-dependent methyltransferase [Alphaproteobacteria bacterium]